MKDEIHQQKKDSVLKSLAIFGFIGIIILIAWLSVKLVDLAPNAFSSLASLAETIRKEQTSATTEGTPALATLPFTSNPTLTNAGEPVAISWAAANLPGSYVFSYECAEGVAIDLIDVPNLGSITCNTNYTLGDVTELRFSVDSEKERYTDVRYTISFFGTNDTTPRAIGAAQLTVINSKISSVIATTVTNDDTTVPETTPTTPEPEPAPAPAPETPSTPAPTLVTPTPSYTEEVYTYVIPTSDPAGRTDLGVRFIGTGSIVGNSFVPSLLTYNKAGALQFEVKNHGTKTSATWTFSVTMPDGSTYRSPAQVALKPNERALLTIGFAASTVREHTFVVIATEPTDQVTLNDSFRQTVTFVR